MRKPSPAMTVALLALFAALSTSSVAEPLREAAARKIAGKQIKANAITTKHVRNGSLRRADFKAGELPVAGGPSPAGPPGPRGADGAAGRDGGPGKDGTPGAPGPSAARIAYSTTQTSVAREPIGTVGPWTVYAQCFVTPDGGGAGNATMELAVSGPGGAQHFGHLRPNDGDTANQTVSGGMFLGPGPASIRVISTPDESAYQRYAATFQLHSQDANATVTIDAFADARGSGHNCQVRGTGVLAD